MQKLSFVPGLNSITALLPQSVAGVLRESRESADAAPTHTNASSINFNARLTVLYGRQFEWPENSTIVLRSFASVNFLERKIRLPHYVGLEWKNFNDLKPSALPPGRD